METSQLRDALAIIEELEAQVKMFAQRCTAYSVELKKLKSENTLLRTNPSNSIEKINEEENDS